MKGELAALVEELGQQAKDYVETLNAEEALGGVIVLLGNIRANNTVPIVHAAEQVHVTTAIHAGFCLALLRRTAEVLEVEIGGEPPESLKGLVQFLNTQTVRVNDFIRGLS